MTTTRVEHQLNVLLKKEELRKLGARDSNQSNDSLVTLAPNFNTKSLDGDKRKKKSRRKSKSRPTSPHTTATASSRMSLCDHLSELDARAERKSKRKKKKKKRSHSDKKSYASAPTESRRTSRKAMSPTNVRNSPYSPPQMERFRSASLRGERSHDRDDSYRSARSVRSERGRSVDNRPRQTQTQMFRRSKSCRDQESFRYAQSSNYHHRQGRDEILMRGVVRSIRSDRERADAEHERLLIIQDQLTKSCDELLRKWAHERDQLDRRQRRRFSFSSSHTR